ncbi:hypothetical protein J4760_12900 [Salinicoccus sp. ID82-1]|uniref:YobI family P-loop NTPase n=1 Tax=Salinicoccus sp. ID82-1 TaxID=2820269 RepID=UPI001F1BE098|nr:hypothetical protein [Salinicoccus sp. ID82-1]MCG1010920.1 hypothetical protein [Salinicoccus sp. ID82-1]
MSNDQVEFEKLTPIQDYDLNIYEDGLNFIFENQDIKNIAITGPYGAGKTSLIETFKKSSTMSFIHISLAHFNSKKEEDSLTVDESILEGKILNQLIHQIDPTKIPKTNFKVKQKVDQRKVAINTIKLLTMFILLLYLFFYNSWSVYISQLSEGMLKEFLLVSTIPELKLLSLISILLLAGKSIYNFFIMQSNRNMFKRLNLQGNEIEILEENDESYFDKYLNEVLYIFENSDADAIVFEDIDRYDVTRIFEKLREINTLVNNKKEVPLRFIFLLRDDVFISKDRTKFFDFILPVVPVIDGSNSYEQFLEHFKNGDINKHLDTKFLQGISLYIDDMRILKNIYNEFLIYKNRLNSIELNFNKLLALIAYKNIFPRDFSDLQLSSGFVHTLFNKKKDFADSETSAIEQKIEEKKNLISRTSNEESRNLNELDAIYFNTQHDIVSIGGNSISKFSTRAEIINALRENPKSIKARQLYNNIHTVSVQSDFEKLESMPEYLQRRTVINNKSSSAIEKLNSEIRELKKERDTLKNKKLEKIINKNNVDTIFRTSYTNEIGEENKFKEIKSSAYFPLIKYLIRNGYIDETYSDYMTYFYENSLSISDKIFLRSISDQEAKEFGYSLKDAELVVSRLNLSDFQQVEILNLDLLHHLLNENESNPLYLKAFIKQLEDTKNFKFIEEFIEKRVNLAQFINNLNSVWPNLFEEMIETSNYSEQLKTQLALYYLNYSDENDLEVVNTNNYLTSYVSNNADFLNVQSPDSSKLITAFSCINISFNVINFSNAHEELLQKVYENHLFSLNYDLIVGFLKEKYDFTTTTPEDFRHKNYSLIMSKKEESLFKYVNENIQDYLEVVLDNCEEKISDNEVAALDLLNNSIITFGTKVQYLKFLRTSMESIEEVHDYELWPVMIKNQLVAYNDQNILAYYFNSGNGLDTELIEFINGSAVDLYLDKDYINTTFGEKAASEFYDSVVQSNDLSNERYQSLLKPFNYHYKLFSFEGISLEKIDILIDISAINMNEDNLTFMRTHYKDLVVDFIVKNIKDYSLLINEKNFIFKELLALLDSPISTSYKLQFLQYAQNEISIRNKSYNNELKLFILEHNFDIEDTQFLVDNYANVNDEFKEKIKDLILENFDYVIDKKLNISFNLLKEIFHSTILSIDQKKELLVSVLENLSSSQTKEILRILNFSDYLGLFERKRPKIPNTDIDKQILSIFKIKGWITRFYVDSDNSKFFRVHGRKVK